MKAKVIEDDMIGGIMWNELQKKFSDPAFDNDEFINNLPPQDLDRMLEL